MCRQVRCNAIFLRKEYCHTFQAQDHSLLGHDVEQEVIAERGEKEVKSRGDAKQYVIRYIQSLIAFPADCNKRNWRWWDGSLWKSRRDLDGMCCVVRHQANPESH